MNNYEFANIELNEETMQKVIAQLVIENANIKRKIDEAIEYLEKSKLNQLDTHCKYLYINFDTGRIEHIEDLLDILKGE